MISHSRTRMSGPVDGIMPLLEIVYNKKSAQYEAWLTAHKKGTLFSACPLSAGRARIDEWTQSMFTMYVHGYQ